MTEDFIKGKEAPVKKEIKPELPSKQGFTFDKEEVQLLFQSLIKDEELVLAQRVLNGNAKLKLAVDIEKALTKVAQIEQQ